MIIYQTRKTVTRTTSLYFQTKRTAQQKMPQRPVPQPISPTFDLTTIRVKPDAAGITEVKWAWQVKRDPWRPIDPIMT